ncbi:hypothetical protein PFISCL1PPCAC_3304 [Pristionchus fissidentatus]|uniref:Uncharacterized protein n=1 Tax=Pristionchus fissidentatus TaxID=1538716 RepID=A0AAV5UXJ3_9BILA|nr:hypothetical protein PFISCL1PPCAC_3304 [Pristionchus fissidentatus]
MQMRLIVLACLLFALVSCTPLMHGTAHKRHLERVDSVAEIRELRDLIEAATNTADQKIQVCGPRLSLLIRAFEDKPCEEETVVVLEPNFNLTDKCCNSKCTISQLKHYLCMIFSK